MENYVTGFPNDNMDNLSCLVRNNNEKVTGDERTTRSIGWSCWRLFYKI